MRKLHFRSAAVVLAAAALLSGCGSSDGDSSGPSSATSDVPQRALSSVDGLIAYMNELIGMTSETSSPVVLGDAVLPVDDTATPSPVN